MIIKFETVHNSWDFKTLLMLNSKYCPFFKLLLLIFSVNMCSFLNPMTGLCILMYSCYVCAASNMGINIVDTNLLNFIQIGMNIWVCHTLYRSLRQGSCNGSGG